MDGANFKMKTPNNVGVEISTREIARVFFEMNDTQKAIFFGFVGDFTEKHGKDAWEYRLSIIPTNDWMGCGAHYVMQSIGIAVGLKKPVEKI